MNYIQLIKKYILYIVTCLVARVSLATISYHIISYHTKLLFHISSKYRNYYHHISKEYFYDIMTPTHIRVRWTNINGKGLFLVLAGRVQATL